MFDSQLKVLQNICYMPILPFKNLKNPEFQTCLSLRVSGKELWSCIFSLLTKFGGMSQI